MSMASTASSASETELPDGHKHDTDDLDIKSQPAVVAWDEGHAPATSRHVKADFALDLHWNPSRNKAFVKLCTTLSLKDNKGKTHVYLFIPPERIRVLSVGTSQSPPPDELASNPNHIGFHFDLQGPANFVGPKIPLRPRDSSSGATLDCLRALALQTTFEIHTTITPRALPRWKLGLLCDTFRFPNHGVRSIDGHARMTGLYGGRGGRVVEVKHGPDSDESPKAAAAATSTGPIPGADEPGPPSYDQLATNPPLYVGDPCRQTSKRRRVGSSGASDAGQSSRSAGEGTAKHAPGEPDKPGGNLMARFLGDRIDSLPGTFTARLVGNIFKEFDGDRRAKLVVPILNRLGDDHVAEVVNHLANGLDPDQLALLWGYLQELGSDRVDAIFLRLYTQLDDETLQSLGRAHHQAEPHSAHAKLVESPDLPVVDGDVNPLDERRAKLVELGITTLIRQQLHAQVDSALPKIIGKPSELDTEDPDELREWMEDKLEGLKYWYECQFENVESELMDFVRGQVGDVFDERLADLDPAFGDLVRAKIREAFGSVTLALEIDD